MVELDRDRDGAARRLTRRLPARPDPHALLGTAFHDWVQRFYGAERLFDLDDLPGAGDPQTTDAAQLDALQAAFNASAWAARTPLDVEVPFELALGDTVVRGRIDAVFGDPDGGVTVVDWKTGEPPVDDEALRHAAVQLAVYRLAWAGLAACPVAQVRAAFHYVRSGRTVMPENLYSAEELAVLLKPELLRPDEEHCAGSPAPV
jgi:DNA helicase-2/ATP-dependent DNA helicase PcrA